MAYRAFWRGITIDNHDFDCLSFPLQVGVDVVFGKNGSGKTTFLAAVRKTANANMTGGVLHGILRRCETDSSFSDTSYRLAAAAVDAADYSGSPIPPTFEFEEIEDWIEPEGDEGDPIRFAVTNERVWFQQTVAFDDAPAEIRKQQRERTGPRSEDPEEIRAEQWRTILKSVPGWCVKPTLIRKTTGVAADSTPLTVISETCDVVYETRSSYQRELILHPNESRFDEWVSETEILVNKINRMLFSDAHEFALKTANIDSIRAGLAEPFRWVSMYPSLNETHERFFQLAFSLALFIRDFNDAQPRHEEDHIPRALLLLDEPERGLHPTLVQDLGRGLTEIAETLGIQVVLCTHHPAFLANPKVRRWKTTRVDRQITLRSCELPVTAQQGRELGITASDVLMTARLFLFVEGLHDRAVLGGLFGEEFRNLGIHLIPISGVNYAAGAATAEFLTYSDARVALVVDNLDPGVTLLWDQCRQSILDGNPADQTAVDVYTKTKELGRKQKGRQDEYEVMATLFSKVIKAGTPERLEIVPLSEPDILDYLPPTELLPGCSETWSELRLRSGSAHSGTKFKSWLKDQYGNQALEIGEIERTVSAMDSIPLELTSLLERVTAFVTQR